MKKFTADFETCTWLENETFVWAWAVCEIGNEDNLLIGNDIDSFMEFAKSQRNAYFYWHNLKFDGEFLIYWAFTHGFKHVENIKDVETNTFTTLIGEMGQFYSITLYFSKKGKNVHKVTFYDSLKIIPFSVSEIAKAFNLPISKLEIDYNKPRKRKHKLTKQEEAYIKNDVLIVAKALNVLFNEGLTKMTQGSNALGDYKKIINKWQFKKYFPELELEIDSDLRKSYKGGFTYLNPLYKDKEVGKGVVLDVNSLYPSVMFDNPMPIGEPVFFEGEYKEDKEYPLYIQMLTCSFEIKKNKIPTIQIKKHFMFLDNEYLTSSDKNIVTLVLTNVDLELFKEHYNIYEPQYKCGWKFKSKNNIFKSYIDKWIKVKNEATISGNKGMRTLAKLMLNSLYGKMATKLVTKSKYPFLRKR